MPILLSQTRGRIYLKRAAFATVRSSIIVRVRSLFEVTVEITADGSRRQLTRIGL